MATATRICPQCNTPLPDVAAFCYVCGTATPTAIDRRTGEIPVYQQLGITKEELRRRLQLALGPNYVLGETVGEGGFAEVVSVHDQRLKRDLAIKVLRPDLVLAPAILQRFRGEAEKIAALRHPNIVPVYDVGEGQGLSYIIMPLIKGETLKAKIDREGRIPIAETRRILLEAANGLAAAHEAGVVHRDIKPENIMLEGKHRRILLMDFGIAKAVDTAGDQTLTSTGLIVGTPQYMSPEQAAGERNIDHHADQYSLAVVGYRMLTGTLPFQADSTRAVLFKQVLEEPTPIETHAPDVPPQLAAALARAMAKQPGDRYNSMEEFAEAVSAIDIAGPATSTVPAPPEAATTPELEPETQVPAAASRPPAQPRSRKGLMLAGVAATVAVVAGIAISRGRSAEPVAADSTTVVAPAPAPPPVTDSAPAAPAVATTKPAAPLPASGVATTKAPKGKKDLPKASDTAAPKAGPTNLLSGAGRVETLTCAKAYTTSSWSIAFEQCTREAEAGNAAAERMLGTLYEEGHGVVTSLPDAIAWYVKAANGGDVPAMIQLAHLHEEGRGVAKDQEKAVDFYMRASAAGSMQASLALGRKYETGNGISKDYAEAANWYHKAADQGSLEGQVKLGEFYARGRGVTKDEAESARWYTKAADRGDAEAQFRLAEMYFKGKGVEKSDATGLEWLRKSAAQGFEEAVKSLKKREPGP